jgi:hypothetical protein
MALSVTSLRDRIYNGLMANSVACGFGASVPPAAQAMILAQSEVYAQAIVDEITANGEAVIPTGAGGAGLQRTPNPNNPDTATQAPSAEKTLALR